MQARSSCHAERYCKQSGDRLHLCPFSRTARTLRTKLNKLLKRKWEEWELPREADSSWPAEAKAAHAEWWQLRRARQKEIDASIARRAESEILYDQPYEDPKRIRVSGPFTVESLSPHRMLDASVAQPRASGGADPGAFVTTILDNLKKAGVQNTVKNERLVFDRLSPFAGKWIHAEGEFTDKGGAARRVAISIGPEHGTVSPTQVRSAAKEALKHFDMVVICGFAFDALAYEAAKELSPRNGNGAPSARSGATPKAIHSTDDIACWFIDTDYNNESFFVRHAYFTGGQDPYEKLKRALKAEIDESTWASLYTTKSRPFDPPSTGLIAVKVAALNALVNVVGADEVASAVGKSHEAASPQRRAPTAKEIEAALADAPRLLQEYLRLKALLRAEPIAPSTSAATAMGAATGTATATDAATAATTGTATAGPGVGSGEPCRPGGLESAGAARRAGGDPRRGRDLRRM